MQKVLGYKAYHKGLVNQFDEKYEIGKDYIVPQNVKWQNNGFHFSRNMEDVLRYYNGFEDIEICVVLGYGQIQTYYDEYYEYETLVSDHLRIIKVLSREEIIDYALKLMNYRLYRFVAGFKLMPEEIELFYNKNDKTLNKYIDYYQYGDVNVFSR